MADQRGDVDIHPSKAVVTGATSGIGRAHQRHQRRHRRSVGRAGPTGRPQRRCAPRVRQTRHGVADQSRTSRPCRLRRPATRVGPDTGCIHCKPRAPTPAGRGRRLPDSPPGATTARRAIHVGLLNVRSRRMIARGLCPVRVVRLTGHPGRPCAGGAAPPSANPPGWLVSKYGKPRPTRHTQATGWARRSRCQGLERPLPPQCSGPNALPG